MVSICALLSLGKHSGEVVHSRTNWFMINLILTYQQRSGKVQENRSLEFDPVDKRL